MRPILAVSAAALVGTLGAVVLGEYPFKGVTVLAAGLVFGLLMGEAALAVARAPSLRLGVACAAAGGAATTWAAWISTGHDLSYLGPAGAAAIVIAAAASGARTGVRAWSRRGPGTPAAPAPAAPTEERPA